MNPIALELQARTHKFATAVIKLCEQLPRAIAAQKIAEQLIDSAGSTDSNYRATCRARSDDEFIAKVGVAAEEADESKGWLELLVSAGHVTQDTAGALIQEADELTAIFVKSQKTAKRNRDRRKELEKQLRAKKRR